MKKKESNILVIGGGIAGISSALDLANQGYDVILVERGGTIGGHMAKLDKTFPTLDCSICILSPKMVEVSRHPRIRLLTRSEVVDATETESGFRVKIVKKPRYVDESKCTGCGICMSNCPSKHILNEFNEGLDERTAIWIPFPQAVPRTALIDPDRCLKFTEGKCGVCFKKCPVGAVDYTMTPVEMEEEVSSILLATGFELLEPVQLMRYGYLENQNVITSLQLERMLNASGPTKGHIQRPSDGGTPSKIAFILCAGSRDTKCKEYCSRICCMYSAKDAILLKEHLPGVEVTIFFNDLRGIGNGSEDFLDRAEQIPGIHYRRGLPAQVEGDQFGNLSVRYQDMERASVADENFDLVVLFTPIIPSSGIQDLAEVLDISLDSDGFVITEPGSEVQTTKEGIYVCGCAKGPEDIATSVTEGMAAASLASGRSRLPDDEVREEGIVALPTPIEPPRVGVFVCSCGSNIGGVVDVDLVASFASTLPDVVLAKQFMYACSEDTQREIQYDIEEKGLNRILIAACSPRSHLNLFRETAHSSGLNPNLVGLVSLREMDSWVHMHEPEVATEKAKTIVRMGVANMRHAQPLAEIERDVEPAALVVGGGVAGMSAALAIATSGFKAVLVEKEAEIGGSSADRARVQGRDLDPVKLVEHLRERIRSNENIKVMTNTVPSSVKGSIGRFDVDLRNSVDQNLARWEKKVERVGAIVVATGALDLNMRGYYNYGKDDRVASQSEFQELTARGERWDTVVQVLCSGARDRTREYCGQICCETALRGLVELKTRSPETDIYVLYRDIRTSGLLERLYSQASSLGIKFIRYDLEHPPDLEFGESVEVSVRDQTLDTTLRIDADLLVLSQPLVPNPDNKLLSEMLKIPLSQDGFFLEAHPKLRPVDCFTDGVFLAGSAQGPKGIAQSITQGLAAASRALIPLLQGKVVQEPTVAVVEEELCTGCARCVEACPFGAMGMEIVNLQVIARADSMMCKGCGKCVVACPSRAISLYGFTNDQMISQIDEALELASSDDVRGIAFLCNWCAYAGADNAGVSRFQYPPNLMPIRVMCSGRVDPLHVLYALLKGADGVLIGGCHMGDCHYVSGNDMMKTRIERLMSMVEDYGFDPSRIRIEWVSASEGRKFAQIMTEFVDDLRRLGPNPLRPEGGREKEKGVA